MSLHANNAETEARLRRQRALSSVASFAIGGLVVALVMLVMALILLTPLFKETPTIVTYQAGKTEEEQPDQKQQLRQQPSKPSAPSSAMSRVIAANTASPTAIPVPDINVDSVSETFGMGDDFGDGWNGAGDGGFGGGGTSFFSQKVSAQRVAYVIDYSASMKGERESLMRAELTKSVGQLTGGMAYALIFFAGPVWEAGDVVKGGKGGATVEHGGREFKWATKGGAHGFHPVGTKQVPDWIEVRDSKIKKSLEQIQETKLVWGTIWGPPLEMAMSMEPPPQVIFFMTDGSIGGDSVEVARTIGAKAKSKGIVINTVAMMQPKAQEGMQELAKRSGGQFSIVEKGGKVRKGSAVEAEPKKKDSKKKGAKK